MADFTCPQCHAAVESDLIESTGKAECPFCGADLSQIGLPEPAAAATQPELETIEIPNSTAAPVGQFPALPEKSRIKVVEATDSRLVLYIPGGGAQATGIGCFALIWNLFMCAFTPPWVFGMLQGGNNGPPLLFIIPFLGLFWAVGLGMAFAWMKMKFQRTFLLLDRDQVALQRVFFNRKRLEETMLTGGSRAELVESYKQNDQPVYRIEIRGKGRNAKFGTALSDDEKNWLVDRINEFLGADGTAPAAEQAAPSADATAATRNPPTAVVPVIPDSCSHCGAPLTGKVEDESLTCAHCGAVFRIGASPPVDVTIRDQYERLDSASLPADSPIRIDEDSPEALQFHYLAGSNSPMRWIVPLFAIPFSLAWFAALVFIFGVAWQMPFLPVKIVFTLVLIPFVLAGLVPLGIGLLSVGGRATIRLTRESLTCRWHVSLIGISKSLRTEEIDSVRVEVVKGARQNQRVRGAQPIGASDSGKCCLARAGGKKVYLTFFQDEPVARQIASLLRTRLEDMGHKLRDV